MPLHPPTGLACALLLLASHIAPATAASAVYQLDPVHTRVMVAVEHAGFSKAIGTVSGSSGRIEFDPADWSTATVQVSVPLDKLDFGDPKWNAAVQAGNLLDGEHFATAVFRSTRVEAIDATHATVHGDLSLRGVSREVKLDVTLNALKRHPLPPFRRTAGFSASTVLSRADFGIDAWKSVIGDEVELRLEVEATRTRRNGAADAGETAEDAEDDQATRPPTEPTP
jgi:polyisoprenoid-binding protein YceI